MRPLRANSCRMFTNKDFMPAPFFVKKGERGNVFVKQGEKEEYFFKKGGKRGTFFKANNNKNIHLLHALLNKIKIIVCTIQLLNKIIEKFLL